MQELLENDQFTEDTSEIQKLIHQDIDKLRIELLDSLAWFINLRLIAFEEKLPSKYIEEKIKEIPRNFW